MADISKVKLPDGVVYDIKDANAATKTYVDTGLDSKLSIDYINSYIILETGDDDGFIKFTTFDEEGNPHSLDVPIGGHSKFLKYNGSLSPTSSNPINLNNEEYRGSNGRCIYWLQVNQYCSNAPVSNGSYGTLECFTQMQRFTKYDGSEIYYRHYANNAWTTWRRTNETIHSIVSQNVTTAVSTATATYTNVVSITLGAGMWQINAQLTFAANSTGNRTLMVSTTETGSSPSSWNNLFARVRACGDSETTAISANTCVEISSNTTLYLKARQNSGGNLNITNGTLRAIRIA